MVPAMVFRDDRTSVSFRSPAHGFRASPRTGAALPLGLLALAAFQPAAAEPATLDDVFVDRHIRTVASGIEGGFTEGPLWHPDGFLLFADFNTDRLLRVCPETGKVEVFRQPSHVTNGSTLDAHNRLLSCEMASRRVTRTEADGTITVLTAECEGVPYNSPNDIVVDRKGRIYFTDPDWFLGGRKPGTGGVLGVYRIDPDGTVTRLLGHLQKPNGLAFSPDERRLYIACDISSKVIACDVAEDGSLTNERVFAGPVGVPDGMKVDRAGRLFVASSEGIVVFDETGAKIGTLPMPNTFADGSPDPLAANCAFGGRDWRTLFVTARGGVFSVAVKVPGIGAGRAMDCDCE
jgi:gluconolactonase